MGSIEIKMDFSQVIALGKELKEAQRAGLHGVLFYGKERLQANAPEGKSNYFGPRRKLNQGAEFEILEIGQDLLGQISISAISAQGPSTGLVTLRGGRTKVVKLRGTGGYDYASNVADGSGIFGPAQQPIVPREAKVLIIPVKSVPTLNGRREVYIEAGGQTYIIRKNTIGHKAHPFVDKTLIEMEQNAQTIFDGVLNQIIK